MQHRYSIQPAEMRLQSLNFAVISLANNTNSLLREFTLEVRAIQQKLQTIGDAPSTMNETLAAIKETLDTMVENQHTMIGILTEIRDSPFNRSEVR